MLRNVKPIQQKLGKIYPNLEFQIKAKLNKLLEAKIIFRARPEWVSNLFLVIRKNGDIKICIEFRDEEIIGESQLSTSSHR